MTTLITQKVVETTQQIADRNNARARRKLRVWMGLAYSFMLAAAFILWFFPTTIGGVAWNWGLAVIFVLIDYTWRSIKMRAIGPSQIGVRQLFRNAYDQVGPGAFMLPPGFFTLEIFSNEVQQAELPAEGDLVYEGTKDDPDAKDVPDGKVAAIRILFGSPENADTTDPYDQRMVCKVTPVIRYRIVDGVKFIRNIGTWEKARIQIEDAVVSVLSEELGKVTPAKAMTQLSGPGGIYEKLEKSIDELLKSWGIDLESVRLKPFTFSHALNEAVLEVPKAQREKDAQIIRAEGKSAELRLLGEGEGAGKKAKLVGETDGLKDRSTRLVIDGPAVLAAEVAQSITSNPGQKTVIVGSEGFNQLAKVGAVLSESFANQKGV